MATNGNGHVNGDAPNPIVQHNLLNPLAPQGLGRPNNEIVIGARDRRCEIYKFNSEQALYASAWSNKNDIKFRLAVGTITDIATQPKAPNKVGTVILDPPEFASLKED
uniref:MSP domain-containing protein n=1 Tax=Caenorhabditis tropicalis TaxID=1561998 RepID=A0A1I7U272_9PELO